MSGVDQTPGTISTEQPAAPSSQQEPSQQSPPAQTGFGSRGRARRRARFLRRARELAYRDLGGLVFNLHRFGARNDALVLSKLATLIHIDGELRTIETALRERHPVTVLREAGIAACPRCAAIHGSEDRFCPNCGLPMAGATQARAASATSGPPEQARAPEPAVAQSAPHPGAGAQSGATEQSAAGSAAADGSASARPERSSPARAEPRAATADADASAPRDESRRAGGKSARPAAGRNPTPRRSAKPKVEDEVEEPTEILHPPTSSS